MKRRWLGLSRNFKKTINALDEAISAHIRENRSGNGLLTGWMVIASVSDSNTIDRDGYIMQASPGMSHQAQLGLLNMALDDKKNISLIATIRALMGDD
jgi:hypothetical protein